MRARIVGIVLLSAVLIPALLFRAGSAGGGGSAGRADGSRTVTFHVA